MRELIEKCVLKNAKDAKKTLLDRVSRRSIIEKVARECHYRCSLEIGVNHIKFNNKYPFRTFLGGDEFFSALFSLGNLVATIGSYHLVMKRVRGNTNLVRLNKVAIKVNILSWVFSMVYHYHICRLTRDLDYFFAFLNILVNFYICLLRLLYVYRQKRSVENFHRRLKAVVTVFYILHVYNMYFIDFNFRRHKQISSAFIGISLMMWFYLAYTFKKMVHSRYLLVFVVGMFLSGTIEISDIPPLCYLLDSHAVYHFITMFIQPFYYLFIKHDLNHFMITNR